MAPSPFFIADFTRIFIPFFVREKESVLGNTKYKSPQIGEFISGGDYFGKREAK